MKDIIVSVIENALWPTAIVIAVFFLKKDIRILVSRFKGIKAGDIEIQMRQQIHSQSLTEDQLAKLSAMSAAEIDLFLLVSYTDAVGFNYNVPLAKEIFEDRLEYFETLGLIKLIWPKNENENVAHLVTAEGRRVREAIVNGASQLLKSSI